MTSKLLYPRFTAKRKVLDLSGMWRFQFDVDSKAAEEQWKYGLPEADLIPVPSSFNDVFTDKEKREFAGDIWYETDLYVPSEWEGRHLELRFSGVTNHAAVYVNGDFVGDHTGGYTPFSVVIHDLIDVNKKNKVVVKVSNLFDDYTLPIGKTSSMNDGRKMVKVHADYYHYAGIPRPVKLVALPQEHVTDFSVGFELDASDANVSYSVETTGDHEVEVEVFDESQQSVASSTGKENELFIKNARLWKPLDAYLYRFFIRIYQEGALVDEYFEDIGIRTVTVQGNTLYINENPVYLQGFYKREDSELHGAGMNPAVLKRDFELMKWSGANFLSTADFPHCEELYQMADREGFLVINSIPGSGLKKVKPDFFEMMAGKREEDSFFNREKVQTKTKQSHKNVVEEVIGRDKNHASVIAWNLMTEPDASDAYIVDYAKDIFAYAHELDKQKRPRTALLPMGSTPENNHLYSFCDMISLNSADGWDELGGYEASDAEMAFEEVLDGWKTVHKPVLITIKGVESLNGEAKLPSVQWSESYQLEILAMVERVTKDLPYVVGKQISFADFQVAEGLTAVDLNRSGVFTRNRQPKMAAYVLRNKWKNTSILDKENSIV